MDSHSHKVTIVTKTEVTAEQVHLSNTHQNVFIPNIFQVGQNGQKKSPRAEVTKI